MNGRALEVSGLQVRLGGQLILEGIDLVARRGEWTSIIGPNGAGKTTALRAVAGLVDADAGSVTILGGDTTELAARGRACQVASMPQNPVIPPRMKVVDYILLGRTPHLGRGLRPLVDDLDVVEETMAAVGLDGFGSRRVDQLSGGERQRVVVARAIAQRTPLLLLDEPTTSLDIGHQQDVLETIDQIRSESGVTVVATLHDLSLAAQYSDHLVLMDEGRVVSAGEPSQVLDEGVLSKVYGAELDVVREGSTITVIPRRRRRS
ncbi:MAG: ABC transporter ATP-binding protein [Acidimicrobiales bacterium]